MGSSGKGRKLIIPNLVLLGNLVEMVHLEDQEAEGGITFK
jgi:hypothetical protein